MVSWIILSLLQPLWIKNSNPDSLWAAMKYFDIDNRNFITNKNLRDALVGFLILIIIILIIINEKSQKKKKHTQKG